MSLQTGGKARGGVRGWGCPGLTLTQLGELLPPHLLQLYLPSIEVGLGLDGVDGGQELRGSPSPPTQGARSQEQSQECRPRRQHGGGSDSDGTGGNQGQDDRALGRSPLSVPPRSAAQEPGPGRLRLCSPSPRPGPGPHPPAWPYPGNLTSTLHFPAGPWRHSLCTKSELTSGYFCRSPQRISTVASAQPCVHLYPLKRQELLEVNAGFTPTAKNTRLLKPLVWGQTTGAPELGLEPTAPASCPQLRPRTLAHRRSSRPPGALFRVSPSAQAHKAPPGPQGPGRRRRNS